MIKPGRPLLSLLYDRYRMMQIVKPVYLRNVQPVKLRKRSALKISLMSRHMKRIKITFPVGFQTVINPFHAFAPARFTGL